MRVLAGLPLVIWGAVNGIFGFAGARGHPSQAVGPLFAVVGAMIVMGGVGYAAARRWRAALTVVGLLALSVVALYSASVLRGWSGMNVSHHVVRALISAALFAFAVLADRRTRAAASTGAGADLGG